MKIKQSIIRLFVLALLCTGSALAENITITIKEKGDGRAVEAATVVLDKSDLYDETNAAGTVTFSNITPPKHIKVLAPGYETLHRKLEANRTNITLYIKPLVVYGMAVEVTANRIQERASKLQLSRDELLKSAGSGGDPLKALTALPGIVASTEGSAEVYMRGSNGNENIIWANRAPIGYLYHFGGFQSTINPALIEDINVFLGGFPVEYGDALGGAIDVQLRPPKTDRLRYRFDLSTISSSFLVEGPIGNSGDGFYVSGRRSYLDLVLSPAKATDLFSDDDEEDPDRVVLVPRFYDFQALYRHQLSGGYLDTYLFTAGDKMAMELVNTAKSDPQLAGALNNKQEYQTLGVTWKQRWNDRWDSISSLAYIRTKDAQRLGRDETGNAFFGKVQENSFVFQPELNWRAKANTQLSFGFSGYVGRIPVEGYGPRSYTEDDPDYDFTSQQKFRINTTIKAKELAPYIKHRYQWNKRLTSIIGLRHTNIEVSGGFHTHKFSPRASLEYQLSPKSLLSATWGQYIQMPAGEQIVKAFGNPGLLMTEAEHRILGIEHQLNSLYSVKAEIYQKPMKNLVISLDENPAPDHYANRGIGEAYGFDLFVKRRASQGKMGWLSLSWAKSRRTNQITGLVRDFSGDQPLTLTLVWGQPFSGSWKRWDWSIKAEARSGRPYTKILRRHKEDETDPDSRWIAEYGDHNAQRLPNYYKVDLRIGREVLLNQSKMKFYIDMQNVTFARNVVDYDYGDEYEKIDNPTEITGISFFPYLGVEMEF